MSPRPASIRIFGALLLAAALIGVGTLLVLAPVLPGEAITPGLGPMAPVLAILWLSGYDLCFWFAIARRANRPAAWIFSGLTVLGLATLALDWPSYQALGSVYYVPMILASLLQAAATAILYRRDAREWLRARGRLPDHEEIFS